MATEVIMPQLGASMEKGTIIEWFKQEGDPVEKGEPIVEVLTDKLELEIESPCSGILLKSLYKTGVDVPVQEVIAYIGQEDEKNSNLKVHLKDQVTEKNTSIAFTPSGITDKGNQEPYIRRTPAARKLAKDHNINLSTIAGTGPNGRILLTDVENYIKNQQTPKATPLAKKLAIDYNLDLKYIKGTGVNEKIFKEDVISNLKNTEGLKASPLSAEKENREIKIEGMRKVIGQRMLESISSAPHVTLITEIDMSNVIDLREHLLPLIEKKTGYRLSYSEIIMKAAALCLEHHPTINASIQDETIILHSNVHIGLAVATEKGLIVPVIKHANQKRLSQLTEDCKTLAKLAHDNKLRHEHLIGGTFTISNLGMYAVDGFTPIINQSQAAILGVGRIQEKPVGKNGAIVLRSMMNVSLSFDHRIVDGAPAAAFLTELKDALEQPFKLLV